jgi:hypothetical protein
MLVLDQNRLRGIDQELKEAVCAAVVSLSIQRVNGSGSEGRILYGPSPRRSIISGQLLPRFDETGTDDETTDIRLAALGMDFQLASGSRGDAHASPRLSVYVKVLPSWDELSNPNLNLQPDFKLLPAVQTAIDTRIRDLRQQKFAAAGVAAPTWATLTPAEKRNVGERRERAIAEAVREAHAEQGIIFRDEDLHEAQAADVVAENENANSPPNEGAEVRVPVARLLRQGHEIPLALLDTADIPAKWLRLEIQCPAFAWALIADDETLTQSLTEFNNRLNAEIAGQITAWLGSDEGKRDAWRDADIRPENVANQEAWEAFRARLEAMPVPVTDLLPQLRMALQLDRITDYADPRKVSVRALFDNRSNELTRNEAKTRCHVAFNTSLQVDIPAATHRPLQLDRVEPSYRFRHFLDYSAIGLNNGVLSNHVDDRLVLRSTWAPSFVQPRIIPRRLDLPVTFAALADPALDIERLSVLPTEYENWIRQEETRLASAVREGLNQADADIETERLRKDIAAQRAEVGFIARGIQLLRESQGAYRQLASAAEGDAKKQLERRAAPYRAWLLTNQSFLNRERGDRNRAWHLFQLAFVLAHVPTLASRMEEFRDFQDARIDEDTVSLLYFPTGGGKSEAFYGTLLLGLFLDRLRGKDRGVSVMIRYPLRLLTLQQGQRLLKLIVHGELLRKQQNAGTWPFEIGFWVGSGNTPNRYAQVPVDVPEANDAAFADDTRLDENTAGLSDEEKRRALRYQEFCAAYNKVSECPVCGEATGLRRFTHEGPTAKRLGIVCFNRDCAYGPAHGVQHLPFLLTDDTIYERAPSVVLGTIDKMAMLGHHTSTIRKLLGMFGLARGVGPTGHLYSPQLSNNFRATIKEDGYLPVFPTFANGQRIFHDPFPSLIIQDEAHLLEESLGTFSGLFDTLLDTVLKRINRIAGTELEIAKIWDGNSWKGPRTPKVIAATATISNPDRQLEVLYQRKALRFPSAGSDIYRSFFSNPAPAPAANAQRVDLERSLPSTVSPELVAPWMRLFVSVMTNDATHTVTSVALLSAFHLEMTLLWGGINDPSTRPGVIARMRDIQGEGIAAQWRRDALNRAVAEGREDEIAALIDLHKIALAYVTNKKGGDQIMDALDAAILQRHRAAGSAVERFMNRLISGGIDMKEIQAIMRMAERTNPGQPYPPIAETLRSIIATSAISHGVDVDRFNSMFFAGLPSDIAEYIQASSRVGRTHVGFVVLVPTPQSRRDRYVVETHDIFHRFLERMIAPPAVERWAENAIRRVLASLVQTWAVLEEGEKLLNASDAGKDRVDSYELIQPLVVAARHDPAALSVSIGDFVLRAIGYEGRGADHVGSPVYAEHYRSLIEFEVNKFVQRLRTFSTPIRFQEYWDENNAAFKPPMTSLRDVDEAGLIVAGAFDQNATHDRRQINPDQLIHVMRAIRNQKGATAETDNDGAAG